jgi:hypothetical protein
MPLKQFVGTSRTEIGAGSSASHKIFIVITLIE